jgi:hypothetical protein
LTIWRACAVTDATDAGATAATTDATNAAATAAPATDAPAADATGAVLQIGIIEDQDNRNRLAKLLRFHSSKSEDTMSSLEQYVSRMKEGQKGIFYMVRGAWIAAWAVAGKPTQSSQLGCVFSWHTWCVFLPQVDLDGKGSIASILGCCREAPSSKYLLIYLE